MPGEEFDLKATLVELLRRSEGILDLARIHRSSWDKLTVANQRYSIALDARNRLQQAVAVAPNDRARASLQQRLKLAKLKIDLFDRVLDRYWRLAKESGDPVADLIKDVKLLLTRVPRSESWMHLSEAILGIDLMQTTIWIAATWPNLEESLLTLRLRLRELHHLALLRDANRASATSPHPLPQPKVKAELTGRTGSVPGPALSDSRSPSSKAPWGSKKKRKVESAAPQEDTWTSVEGAKALRKARLSQGHQQKEAAAQCKVAPATYKKWEQGRRPAERYIAAALAYIEAGAESQSDRQAHPQK